MQPINELQERTRSLQKQIWALGAVCTLLTIMVIVLVYETNGLGKEIDQLESAEVSAPLVWFTEPASDVDANAPFVVQPGYDECFSMGYWSVIEASEDELAFAPSTPLCEDAILDGREAALTDPTAATATE